ncbi:MAG: mechanosensitive ion channel, partial [Flavobacteriales bacterium]|nr:mechanosensitive ion channel [Flavobacteriales bacterium]
MDTQFLLTEILGNTIQDYAWFIGAVLLGFIFKKLISKYLSHLLFKIVGTKGAEVGVDKFDALLTKPIGFFIMLSIIYLGSSHINYPEVWDLATENEVGLKMLINKGFSLIYVYSILWIFLKVIDFIGLILNKRAEATENKMDDQLIPFIVEIAKIITYIFALVIVMGNVFEVDITALAAGLGIGGIALAMASKESLENLLGSFTIFFDQPFTVGDTVTVGTVTGTVEKVGFRSTRIRTFDKSLVT